MVFISRAIISGIFVGLLHVASAERVGKEAAVEDVLLEDNVYWGRALRELQMSVTPAPTPSPTRPPDIEIKIFCTDKKDGTDCDDIPTPSFQCFNDLEAVSFTYFGGTCGQSMNTQSGATCEDFNGGPPTSGEGRIQCDDGKGSTLYEGTVAMGSEFTVVGKNRQLPETLVCVMEDNNGSVLQTLTLNTGGNEDLYLKDKFGSLQVEACDDLDCTVDIVYEYKVTNTGPTALTVTMLDRDRGGETVSLVNKINDPDLSPGEFTTVPEDDVVDVCVNGIYVTTAETAGSSASGGAASDDDEYDFGISGASSRPTSRPTPNPTLGPTPNPTPGPTPRPTVPAATLRPTREPTYEPTPQPTGASDITLQLTCTDDDGTDCDDIQTPKHQCSDGDGLSILQFTYVGEGCDQSMNTQDGDTCKDENGGPPSNRAIQVRCDDTKGNVLYDDEVNVGDEFEVTGNNGRDLPQTLRCTMSNMDDDGVFQTVTINTGGDVDLFLKDKYGSLRLEACDDQDCTVPITYFYEITNTGETDLTVTDLDTVRDGANPVSIVGLVPDTGLPPGGSTVAEEQDILDVCVDVTIVTISDVDGVSPDGATVDADDSYTLSVSGNTRRPTQSPTRAPTPHPTDNRPKIDVDITCSDNDNLRDCGQLETPEPECDSNVDTLVFTYIGEGCEQSRNTQDDFFCQDFDGGPSNDDAARIQCEDEDGREIFDEVVNVGSQLAFGDKDNLPDLIQCFVKDNRDETLQAFTVASTRHDDLFLKDVFGSLQLESCDRLNCRVQVTYIYTIQNDGNTQLEITALDRSREDMNENVVGLVQDTSLLPDENTPAHEPDVIDVCVEASIVTRVEAEGDPPSGSPVTAVDTYTARTEGLEQREIPKPCVSGKGKGGKGKGKGGKGKGGKEKGGSGDGDDDDDYGGTSKYSKYGSDDYHDGEPKGSKLQYGDGDDDDDDECGKGKGKGGKKGSEKGGKGKGT